MTKTTLFKSLLLAAGMLVGGVNCAWADDVPTPVYFNDFSSTEGLTIVGNGAWETDEAASIGQFFYNDPSNSSNAARTNYLLLPTNVFSSHITGNAITIGFWVNKKNEDSFWFAPLFGAYGDAPNPDNGTPMFTLETRGLLYYNTALGNDYCNFEGAQNDKSSNSEGTYWLDDGNWHYYTVTITEKCAKVYFDGVVYNSWTLDNSTVGQRMTDLFTKLKDGTYDYICLGGNQAWGWSDADPAFGFDDFAVYDAALTAEQISAIYNQKTIYTYKVNAVDNDGQILKTLVSSCNDNGATTNNPYPRYINVNGTLYETDAVGGTGNQYQKSFSLTSNNQTETITYTASSHTGVLYFAEAEDVLSSTSSSGAGSRCSNMAGGYASSATQVTTLPAGTYTAYFAAYAGKTTHLYIYKDSESDSNVLTDYTGTGSWDETSVTFTLDKAEKILLKGGSSGGYVFDYIFITGTPAYTVLGDPYYGVTSSYTANKTEQATINAGCSYGYKFINHNQTTNYAWDNFLLPVYYTDGNSEEQNALRIRSDWYEEVTANGNGFTLTDYDWYNNLNNSTIDMTVFYTDDHNFRMESVITTSAGTKKYYNYNLANNTGHTDVFSGLNPVPSSIRTALSANYCWLEVIKEAGAIATTNALGYTTFSSINKLDLGNLPSGLTAYYAASDAVKSGYIKLTETTGIVPGNTGLILIGAPNTVYEIPTSTSDATALTGNLLVACPYREAVDSNANKYVLVKNGKAMEFQSLATNGATIPTGKAYLNASANNARALKIVFDDESTGIQTVQGSGFMVNGEYYNLSGQRVAAPQKGLYIVNGKKVAIK